MRAEGRQAVLRRVALRVSPAVERMFDRLERRVTADDHRALAAALATVDVPPGRGGVGALETRADVVAAQLGYLAAAPGLVVPSEGAEREASGSSATAAALALPSLRAGLPTPEQLDAMRAAIAAGSATWFRPAGTPYGTSLTVLAAVEAEAQGVRLLPQETVERFLRHVEIRRQGALQPPAGSGPADADPVLDRLRYIHALGRLSSSRGDLRFLNAALKLIDLQHAGMRVVRRRAASGGAAATTAALACRFYAASVREQESLLAGTAGAVR